MERMKVTDEMLEDEVVQYISQRHHVTATEVLSCFTMQGEYDASTIDQHSVDLEDNEVEIIHDLIQMYHQK